MSKLDVDGLVKRFGGLVALDGVAFAAAPGEVLGIIGVNGAGKTTLMNCICGIYRPDAGTIHLDGAVVTGMAPHDIATRGVGRTFQVPRVFRRMSLIDNLLVPVLKRRAPDRTLIEAAEAMLERMRLIDLRHNFAEELSGGQQKLLEMARMLMPEPKVVMLDEPFAGVHPTLCRFMIEQIEAMAAAHTTVLLISHDLTSIYRLSSRVLALNQGRVIADGGVDAIRGNPAVIEAYLGS
ncbi:ABC transporter ATP-binding protein [Vineibacter terrae]|uniref:ABC transporter ATP-binding protein n=1 Tax=Vineibacter terrae TaxID=2586908 RepID=A0A5C8PU08_9HYPH|nr:ABC transporter ATP-binding protein [Vineibacter terrae]TXL81561.1 ABC transporter ATP-binding protein [Vineibacter terrae]